MTQRLLHIEAAPGSNVPARVTGLLAQRQISVSSLHAESQPAGCWSIQVTAHVQDDQALERLVKWLNRLVDVTRVLVLSGADETARIRRSFFVTLTARPADLANVSATVALYGAEVLEVVDGCWSLHLAAAPKRGAELVAALRQYGRVDAMIGPSVALVAPRRRRICQSSAGPDRLELTVG